MINYSRVFFVCIFTLIGLTSANASGLKNIALGKPITPITNTQLGDPAWVTDGVSNTGAWYSFQTGTNSTNSFTIDLGAQYAIDSIHIYISQVYGYQVSSSDDGSAWTLRNEANFINSTSGEFGPLAGGYSARYLKYWAYTNTSQYIGIIEFQVMVPAYTVGGNASGLSGSGLVLQNNTQDDLDVNEDGGFVFDTTLVDGATYAVTVKTQPSNPSQTCTVSGSSGMIMGTDITDVAVTCATHCKVNTVMGVTEDSTTTLEACETLILGPDYTAIDGANITLNSGWEIVFMPGFTAEAGAVLNTNVCGQSLCMTSVFPMPLGCHSCVDTICGIDSSCCDSEFDQICLDMVGPECGLVCE